METTNLLINDGILRGYNSIDKAYQVDGYPWGFRLKTSIFYWIETKPKLGDRLGTYTIDPRTGRKCAPKYSTYSPFLYLYLDQETGHVKTGGIDSYNIEHFKLRFGFINEGIGEIFISDEQKQNLRVNHYQHVKMSIPWQLVKYSEERKEEFKKWAAETLKHIRTCEFKDLVEYSEPPYEDYPNGEVEQKVTIKEYVPKEPEQPTHTITADKIKGILENVLPKFNIEVSEYTIFGTYFKILMSVKDRVQAVSMSLNVKTLELQIQGYGGNGGQSIYRKINPDDPKKRHYAMQRIKIPFRRPACNEKDVLNAIERFARNYKAALIEHKAVLMYQDSVNYDELLKP